MWALRSLHSPICASCRLRACIATKQLARSRRSVFQSPFRSSIRSLNSTGLPRQDNAAEITETNARTPGLSPEEAAFQARKRFGDVLPEGILGEEEERVYVRLFGRPLRRTEAPEEDVEDDVEEVEVDGEGSGVLKERADGELEEVEFELEDEAALGESEMDGDDADTRLRDDILRASTTEPQETAAFGAEDEAESYLRAHPLTLANRFSTSPSTLFLPNSTLVEPISAQLSAISNTHLASTAHRVFGGIGLPYSTSAPFLAKTMQARPLGLDAYQSNMSEIEGDVFMACLVPGVYSAVMAVLVETRKRLGSKWAEGLVEKAQRGELRILDAGGGGAGVLAVREVLKAEWERMHEESSTLSSGMGLAEADGRVGGPGVSPPLGTATVLTGSTVLRSRASRLLENTTFVPRLPDYLHTEEARKKGKFDIVIAPHSLWQLREDYLRKAHVQNLWGMTSQEGGVLVVLEKGVARGFELVAGAREMLVENHIKPHSSIEEEDVDWEDASTQPSDQKETGTIIAPCTNHGECPMYQQKGMVKGRRDICHFAQRYIRPPFLQNILGARDKNFEDVKFSYISVMRGRDLLAREHQPKAMEGEKVGDTPQNEASTAIAFAGFEDSNPQEVHSLTLPRAVLPPMKRRGHVILDVCTPSATLERWTVPRSFSKQAFRDARKASWGDLWALGAKTRVTRVPKIKHRGGGGGADMDVKLVKKGGKGKGGDGGMVVDYDEYGRVLVGGEVGGGGGSERGEGGRMRGRRVKGVRDKRDKRGDGNGRRKNVDV